FREEQQGDDPERRRASEADRQAPEIAAEIGLCVEDQRGDRRDRKEQQQQRNAIGKEIAVAAVFDCKEDCAGERRGSQSEANPLQQIAGWWSFQSGGG